MLSDERYPVNLGNPCEIAMLEFAAQIRRITRTTSEIVFRPSPKTTRGSASRTLPKPATCSAGSRACRSPKASGPR
jgi:hypothetical protein